MVRRFRKINRVLDSKKISLILGAFLICFTSVYADIPNDKFKTLLNNNQINDAIELYNTHSEQKWAYWLAKKYIRNGDIDSAVEWYEESIKKDDQNSKFEIAEVLFHNKINYSKSYNYFYELKDSSDKFLSSYAKYYLSIFHRYGINVPLDESVAYKYMSDASKEIELAKYSLIEYKLNGVGTKIDKKNAALMMFEFADQGYTEAEYDYAMMILNEIGIKKDEKIHTWFARDIYHHIDGPTHWKNWLESIASIHGPVHLSVDIDGLDGSLVPATGTPVPGGLTYWHAVQTIETAFENLNVVSADVNEIVPQKDTPLTQFTAAMLVTKIIGCKLNQLRSSAES